MSLSNWYAVMKLRDAVENTLIGLLLKEQPHKVRWAKEHAHDVVDHWFREEDGETDLTLLWLLT